MNSLASKPTQAQRLELLHEFVRNLRKDKREAHKSGVRFVFYDSESMIDVLDAYLNGDEEGGNGDDAGTMDAAAKAIKEGASYQLQAVGFHLKATS